MSDRSFPFIFNHGEALGELLVGQRILLRRTAHMSQQMDDLNDALTDLEEVVTANNTEMEAEFAKLSAATDENDIPAIVAATARLKALSAASHQALLDVTSTVTAPATPPAGGDQGGEGTSDALTVSTASLADATTGEAYTGSVSVSGGTAPYTVSGSFSPDVGLSVDSNGSISGTATTAGVSALSVSVSDSATPPNSASATLSLKIVDPAS